VVEHSIGNGEVDSSILSGSTSPAPRARVSKHRSSSVLRMTGIASGWIGSTTASGEVVKKPSIGISKQAADPTDNRPDDAAYQASQDDTNDGADDSTKRTPYEQANKAEVTGSRDRA
jgi:hypothetical protein